jgi:hypothetical protein
MAHEVATALGCPCERRIGYDLTTREVASLDLAANDACLPIFKYLLDQLPYYPY